MRRPPRCAIHGNNTSNDTALRKNTIISFGNSDDARLTIAPIAENKIVAARMDTAPRRRSDREAWTRRVRKRAMLITRAARARAHRGIDTPGVKYRHRDAAGSEGASAPTPPRA